jgi:hypothetical protein
MPGHRRHSSHGGGRAGGEGGRALREDRYQKDRIEHHANDNDAEMDEQMIFG